jgi:Rod binding domain-containing protein
MSLSPLSSVPTAIDIPTTASPDAVARQVEGLFASLLLKELRGDGREGGLFGGDSSDVLGGMFDQYMGQAIADAGGLGLRDYLMSLERSARQCRLSLRKRALFLRAKGDHPLTPQEMGHAPTTDTSNIPLTRAGSRAGE